MMNITPDQARALAALIHTLRPEWDTAGVSKALFAAKDRGDGYELAHAALYAAAEPTNRTPAVIALAGTHWRTRDLASTSAVPGASDPRCEVHEWERARSCRACRSEALERTETDRAMVRAGIPTERVRTILANALTKDARQLAAGDD